MVRPGGRTGSRSFFRDLALRRPSSSFQLRPRRCGIRPHHRLPVRTRPRHAHVDHGRYR